MEGGCFCGFVRYRAEGAHRDETNCHCSICRRTSAAAFVTWFTVATQDFHFTSGDPTRFQSSEHGTRTFCPRCGTPLTFQSSKAAEEIDVTTCSLDDPESVPPKDHTRVSSRLSWVTLGHLDAFLEGRSSLKI
jgi:hypothetical protein